ncbi:MAG: hypothetical protein R3E94_10580 [Burkholderiaceae bacterium]
MIAELQFQMEFLIFRNLTEVTEAGLATYFRRGTLDVVTFGGVGNLQSDKTLGALVKSLFESCAVPDGFERELLPEDKAACLCT